jgi:two-component system response regulator GlrR
MTYIPSSSTASLGFGITPKPKSDGRSSRGSLVENRRPRVLIIEPNLGQRRLTGLRLGAANITVQLVDTARAALDACVRARPNVVITDLRLPDMGGLEFLKELKSRWPLLSVIVVTAHGSISEAVRATQCGAFGYLVKPIDKAELLALVERATEASTFDSNGADWRECIVSRSRLMEDRLSLANRAAHCDEPVLITGENGTGKELLARAIHAASKRRNNPFTVMQCRCVSQAALQSALAGDEQTSATLRAKGGTLLIDEVCDMSLPVQRAWTHMLKHRATSPSLARSRWPARIICTSSKDLQTLATSGAFLPELLQQIGILPIEIPPLGRRREDIPLLVSHFLEQATDEKGHNKIYSPDAITLLATSDWPGNVRQLFDLVKQNVALARGKVISREFVEQALGQDPGKMPGYDEAREQFSREFLRENMQRAGGSVSKAARAAKRQRSDFYKLLSRYRLQAEDFRPVAAHSASESST